MLGGPVDVFLLVHGNDLTPDTHELGEAVENVIEEVRPYGSTGAWPRQIPIGVGKVEFQSGGGLYDDRQKGIIAALEQAVGVRRLVAWGPYGDAIGADIAMLDGPIVTKFNRVCSLGELTKANPEYVVTAEFRFGRVLLSRTPARTADFNTQASSVDQSTAKRVKPRVITVSTAANDRVTTLLPHGFVTGQKVIIANHAGSTPNINGARTVTVINPTEFTIGIDITVGGTGGTVIPVSSPNGGVADIHVTALALGGHTGLDVDVLHSSDNVSFAPLLSFATVTAAAATHAQRVATATHIERYTAVDGDFTGAGSPSATVLVGLARNA